uniref:CWF19-like protein 2 n=1 Tax=Aceria tosichella TaxID=561515 RepID=A0A6G1SQM8_9ACAR
MTENTKNKISAQIIKAEMLGDQDKVKRLKRELHELTHGTTSTSSRDSRRPDYQTRVITNDRPEPSHSVIYKTPGKGGGGHDGRVQKFLGSIGTLDQMFQREKTLTASDEARMFMKTATKFSREDMETKHFSEEIDDSQVILNKSKKHKGEDGACCYAKQAKNDDLGPCSRCLEKVAKHLVVDNTGSVYMSLTDSKPFLSHMSNIIIRNIGHTCDSFVSATGQQQDDTATLIQSLREMWKSKGYRCIVMETYFRKKRSKGDDSTSGGNHFQVHCLPVKEKHYERSRMSFKQALQECEREWSMNRKLIVTEGRKIQRYLPKGLSYFWVCFDELTNGFGHVIENENDFSRYFGLEVLSGLLDKDFNPLRAHQREIYKDQFERSKDFKLLYSNFRLK